MSPLELKKLKVELIRVGAAKAELDLRIDEHMENVSRLEDSIKIQVAREEELIEKIAEVEKSGK